MSLEYKVYLKSTKHHSAQRAFVECDAKRIVVRAGRRGGKTTGAAIKAIRAFLKGKRVLYATPTSEQLDAFWHEVKNSLRELLNEKVISVNNTSHIIEFVNTKNRIRAKTAWNADTLRGDYADFLILDEYQLMAESAWGSVGAPMLLDNNGDAIFIYTPPSIMSRGLSRAKDKRHASKLFKFAEQDKTGRWKTFVFTSHDNPYISKEALEEIASDMNHLAIRQEIYAEELEEIPGAIWTRKLIDDTRVVNHPELKRVVVGVDPPGGATECGIIVAGVSMDNHYYVLADYSRGGRPDEWASAVIQAFEDWKCDSVVAEQNYGGDMVRQTIEVVAQQMGVNIKYEKVFATRGKHVRAEPVQARYEKGLVHHLGEFLELEEEMTSWVPGSSLSSPNRLDALVWCLTALTKERAEFKLI